MRAGLSSIRTETETATQEPCLNGSQRVVWAVPNCLDDMIFELTQHRKLLVQCTYRFWIGERAVTPQAAPFNRGLKGGAEDDVMKGLLQPHEWVNEPRPYDPVHDDEVTSFGISFGCFRKDHHNYLVLLTRFGEVGRNCSLPNEMPEVIRMQMHGWPDGRHNKASRPGAFSSAR